LCVHVVCMLLHRCHSIAVEMHQSTGQGLESADFKHDWICFNKNTEKLGKKLNDFTNEIKLIDFQNIQMQPCN